MLDTQYKQGVSTQIEFREGLFVRVPGKTDVRIERKRFGTPPEDDFFKVIRPVVNFWIEDAEGPVTLFNPPMELIVRFTQHDLDAIDEVKKEFPDFKKKAPGEDLELVFAYFDLENRGWVLLQTPDYAVEKIGPFAGFGGLHVIKMSEWPADPGSAWGV